MTDETSHSHPMKPETPENRPRLLSLNALSHKRRASQAQLEASLKRIRAEERLSEPVEPPKGWLTTLSLLKIDEHIKGYEREALEDKRLDAWRYLLCFTYSKLYRKRTYLRHRLKRPFHLEELSTDLTIALWERIRDHQRFSEKEALRPTKSSLIDLERELDRLIIDLTFTSRLSHYVWRVLTETLRELAHEPHPVYGRLELTKDHVWLERPLDEALCASPPSLPSLPCDLDRGHHASDQRGEVLEKDRLGDLLARDDLKAWLWQVLPTQTQWPIKALLQALKSSLSPSPFEVYFCWEQKLAAPKWVSAQRGERLEGADESDESDEGDESPLALAEGWEDQELLNPAQEVMRQSTWPQLRTELVMGVIERLNVHERDVVISAASVGLNITSSPKLSEQLTHFGYTYSTFLVQGALRTLREAQQEAQHKLTEALGEDEALSAELISLLHEQLHTHWEELCDD